MEILQLRYFLESANSESFSRTAEKYMVPTTSVSASVKRLEQELGCSLFDRTCNRIVLNENGKKFKETLSTVFFELDGAVELLTSPRDESREIKMLVRAMRRDITDAIIAYTKRHPKVSFDTVFDFSETELDKYDIIIDEKSNIYSEYDSFELFDMRIRFKASINSPLIGKKITLRALRSQPFISLGDNSNMHRMLVRTCRHAGFTPKVVARINDITCHDKMIASGMGIGLGRENDGNEGVAYLDIADFNERYVVHAYYKNKSAHKNLEHFLNYLKAIQR